MKIMIIPDYRIWNQLNFLNPIETNNVWHPEILLSHINHMKAKIKAYISLFFEAD